MLTFRQIVFDNGAIMFLRIAEHDARMLDLEAAVSAGKIEVHNMTLPEAAAWAAAVDLHHMPVMSRYVC